MPANAILLRPAPLDLFVQWPAVQGGAGFSSGLDDATRTVRVCGAGVWRRADVARYFEDQRRIVDAARRRFGALKVFFDVRGWIVDRPESVLQFCARNMDLYRADDRLVALVGSSSYKQASRTALAVGNRQSFISETAAELWLQAYAQNDR